MKDNFWYISLKNEGMDRIIYSKKQSPDTKKVSEFCFSLYNIANYIYNSNGYR